MAPAISRTTAASQAFLRFDTNGFYPSLPYRSVEWTSAPSWLRFGAGSDALRCCAKSRPRGRLRRWIAPGLARNRECKGARDDTVGQIAIKLRCRIARRLASVRWENPRERYSICHKLQMLAGFRLGHTGLCTFEKIPLPNLDGVHSLQ